MIHTLELPMRTAGVVLAAGASTRFDGGAKALAEIEGRPAVEHLVVTLRAAGIDRVGVVVGADRRRIAAAIGPLAEVVENEAWRDGRTRSIQVGLAWAGEAEAVVLAPVDHPFVLPETVAALVGALARDPMAVWVQPVCGGRGGHPVVFRRSVVDSIARLPSAAPLHDVVRRLGVGVARWPTDDAGVLLGTDTVDEYRTALAVLRARRGGT